MKALPPVSPGSYPGPGQASLLRSNCQQWLFQQQQVPANGVANAAGANPSASIAVQLDRVKSPYFYPFAASLQIFFTDANGNSAAPGVFQVDVQTSDIDSDGQFCLETSLTTVNTTGQAGRVQLTLSWCKYVRVWVKSLANNVYANVLVTR